MAFMRPQFVGDAGGGGAAGRVEKKIVLRPQQLEIAQAIQEKHKLTSAAARVLAARGFTDDVRLQTFLQPTLRDGLPHPRDLKNLDAACQLVAGTVAAGGPIAICCDFDVDGLCGGSILHHFLTSVGVKSKVFVPDRFVDGYGLNSEMVKTAAQEGCRLLIAVDFGTTNTAEVQAAAELGVKTLIVDHHHVEGAGPPAEVFINPQQAGCGFADGVLCAAGLVWYLVAALKKELPQAREIDAKDYLDLACLASICDMVPLQGVNRVIAKKGLELLETTNRPGLQALKNVMGVHREVTCSHVGFGFGPRINAAGRIVHGELVVELLTTTNSKRAATIAERLNRLNLERQEIETKIKEEAIRRVSKMKQLPWGIVVADESFHTGVIGIVAQRLVETFYRPALVIGCDNGVYKGSARGIRGFSVVEALGGVSELLLRYGGHTGEGGFSLEKEKISALTTAFNMECKQRLAGLELEPCCDADTAVQLSELDVHLVEELNSFAPFGTGNPAPTLLIEGLRVHDVRVLKNAHLKATVSDGRRHLSALMWQHTSHPALFDGAQVNLACRPSLNSYNGMLELQLQIQAAELATTAARPKDKTAAAV